jgi:hypothetical protein
MHLDDVLTELVEHCGDRLLRVACQLIHDAAAAQDLVQKRCCASASRRYDEGLADHETGALLGCPETTVAASPALPAHPMRAHAR